MTRLLSKSLLPVLLAMVLVGSPAKADRRGGTRGAPEIDPSLAAAGIVLLVGGTLVLTARRRPKTA